ncbi:MAG: AAA family ATPase [Bacteroidales bacterium]|nr:AAA family ATPase [Bacteroidales bacterium]
MKYEKKDYEKFLLSEINTQIKNYEDLVNTRALILKARGDVFVGKFIKLLENGSAVFKVRNSEDIPRKGTFWTACYMIGEMGSFRNWGDLSWLELRRDFQGAFSESSCQWVTKSDDPGFCLVGIKGLDLEFLERIEKEKPIIAFGPKDPPLEYLYNLLDIVRGTTVQEALKMLFYDETTIGWHPQLVSKTDDLNELLHTKLNSSEIAVVQGPPGTGKTFRMAQLAASLLEKGHSVLVTALTNQALMELAKKQDLNDSLSKGLVSKTSLTYDEKRSLPGLVAVPQNKCNATKGHLTLASFYVSSGWAKDATNKSFDYVIMDEASQALLPMVAATRILGKKVILIGDQNQLPPIVEINDDEIARYGWNDMICGFKTVCCNFGYPAMMLKDTFRLTNRAAQFTGIFYDGLLDSASNIEKVPSQHQVINTKGGPVLYPLSMDEGNKGSDDAVAAIVHLVDELRCENPKAEIAVLAKFKDSVRRLQRGFITLSQIGINENIRIDTIDKVQGLTVDYCVFFIPNASTRYSLYEDLFNVATSRATYNTIIVCDPLMIEKNMPSKVRLFISKLR